MKRAYLNGAGVLGAALAVLGIAMVVSTIARGGGPLAFGVLIGILFAIAGAGRLALATGRFGRRR